MKSLLRKSAFLAICLWLTTGPVLAQESPPPPGSHGSGTNQAPAGGGAPPEESALLLPLMALAWYGIRKGAAQAGQMLRSRG